VSEKKRHAHRKRAFSPKSHVYQQREPLHGFAHVDDLAMHGSGGFPPQQSSGTEGWSAGPHVGQDIGTVNPDFNTLTDSGNAAGYPQAIVTIP
jgi:hypothetical protein